MLTILTTFLLAAWGAKAEVTASQSEAVCSADGCATGSAGDDFGVPEDTLADAQKVSLLQGKFRHSRKAEKDDAETKRCPQRAPWPEPPTTPMQYNGVAWPELCFDDHDESVVFLMGDYGGITCGDHETLGHRDPNSWTCHPHRDSVWVKTADNTKDHPDRGRFTFWGTDDLAQQVVARQMQRRYAVSKPHYALNGGDNFYFGGLDLKCGHPMDEIHNRTRLQFDKVFEEMYAGIDVPFFSVFGNHDYGGRIFDAAWDQQIAYTWAPNTTQRWIMPGFYWSQRVRYPKGNFTVDYFMVDTNLGDAKNHWEDKGHNICGDFNTGASTCAHAGGPPNKYACKDWFWKLWNDQAAWLEDKLNTSDADWQVVVTHFPPDQFQGRYWKNLFRKYGIDLFVGSHRHSQEVHINDRRFGGLNWVVCGGGGGITSEWNPDNGHRGRDQYGFMDVKISKERLQIVAINERGEIRRNETIYPRPPQGELSCKHYGCGGEFTDWQGCQCTADCWVHQNCCDDFAQTCSHLARCEDWGCNSHYDWRKPCQCTADCEAKGNCCLDHAEKCNPTCDNYGCHSEYQKWQACQCTDDCWKHGTCCSDYAQKCPESARCEVWGCNTPYDWKKPCQCTKDCEARGNCCEDYTEKCNPSCENYGCASEYQQWQACQCTADCAAQGNCCPDYAKVCPELARCEVWGCNTPYDWKKPCQCTKDCEARGNCCEDYAEKCNPSCKNYGCDSEYQKWQACQCTADCAEQGNCCPDYATVCPQLARCEVWGCNTWYDWKKPCQCTSDCAARGNCCTDYADKCNATCTNYKCGEQFEEWQACSCSGDCWQRGNCCSDFTSACSSLASCANYGCNGRYDGRKSCQCTKDCTARGNCCSDWSSLCDSPEVQAAEAACDTMCDYQGGPYTCRARVEYAMSYFHKSRAEAVRSVNEECAGQCNCTETVIPGSLLAATSVIRGQQPADASVRKGPFPETAEEFDYHDDEGRVVDETVPLMTRDAEVLPPEIEENGTIVEKKAQLLAELKDVEDELASS